MAYFRKNEAVDTTTDRFASDKDLCPLNVKCACAICFVILPVSLFLWFWDHMCYRRLLNAQTLNATFEVKSCLAFATLDSSKFQS